MVCSLGDNKEQIVEQVKKINSNNYENFLEEKFQDRPYYSIKNHPSNNNERYESILNRVIQDAIEEASLSTEDLKDLHIFIGSTSMEMGVNEEVKKSFNEGSSQNEFKEIGNGSIGSYVEKLLDSRHKALLFTTACTSSVNALAHASKLIETKKIKKALVIGVELYNHSTFGGFSSLMLLSQKRVYRPFDERSDGIILGEGCSAIILSDEPKKENSFYYSGFANLCDNFSETTSEPSGQPIFNTMQKALNDANLTLDDITCIKAHATGSENNNSSEARAIGKLFEHHNSSTSVTALKPLLGHTLGACGTNEILLMLASIEHGFIPSTFGFEHPTEDVKFTPLKERLNINDNSTILFNYVAFGGNNSSFILSNKA